MVGTMVDMADSMLPKREQIRYQQDGTNCKSVQKVPVGSNILPKNVNLSIKSTSSSGDIVD